MGNSFNNKIAVIGDSHSRVFSNTNLFTPFFLGPGSKFNLVEKDYNIRENLPKVLELIKDRHEYIALLFGEPTCRYQVNKDHHIHKKFPTFPSMVDQEILGSSTKTYSEIIIEAKKIVGDRLIICAPISVYNPCVEFTGLFSNIIKNFCDNNNILFFNIRNYIVENNEVDNKYKDDPIHANQKVLPFVEEELKKINVLNNNETIVLTQIQGYNEIKKDFDYDEKFGCFKKRN